VSRHCRAGIVLGLALVAFGLLLVWSHYGWQPILYVDQHSIRVLHSYAVEHPAFVTAMKVVSAIGSWSTYSLLLTGTALWLLWRRQPRLALFAAVTPLGSSELNGLAKSIVGRPRPLLPHPVAHAGGFSFPSGHAQTATVAALVLLVVLRSGLNGRGRRTAVGAAALWVLGVGFSRVALGVHYVSDVLAGYALGIACVVVVALALTTRGQLSASGWTLWREPPPAGPPPGT
jgi:undecaprenyl-diphosphatase